MANLPFPKKPNPKPRYDFPALREAAKRAAATAGRLAEKALSAENS